MQASDQGSGPESLGWALSRLYHDLNNVASVLDGNAAVLQELLAAGSRDDDGLTEAVDDIRLGCNLLRDLIDRLDDIRRRG